MYSTSELDEWFQILNSVKEFKLNNHKGATQHYFGSNYFLKSANFTFKKPLSVGYNSMNTHKYTKSFSALSDHVLHSYSFYVGSNCTDASSYAETLEQANYVFNRAPKRDIHSVF